MDSPNAYWCFSAADNCLIRYFAFEADDRSGCISNPNNRTGGCAIHTFDQIQIQEFILAHPGGLEDLLRFGMAYATGRD